MTQPDSNRAPTPPAGNVVGFPTQGHPGTISKPIHMLSEDAIASAFTAHHPNLRFDHSVSHWFEWDGTRWVRDETRRAFHYARMMIRTLARGERSLLKSSVAGGVEKLAQSDPRHAITHDKWDPSPWLLGTPAGTIDLRTGELFPAKPDDYITKQTSVSPEPGAPEAFLAFLSEAFEGNDAMVDYLQRVCGYSLTGATNEHALFFIYGPGGNGKSVLQNTIRTVVGDYSAVAAMEALSASSHDRHPAEIAALAGARLVTASETEANRQLADAKVKQLTGADPVTARFMRGNPFTFTPQFKLLICGNHPPKFRSIDKSVSRRLQCIPMLFVPEKPNKELEAMLAAEHGKILNWMIRGCLEWKKRGLCPPDSVINFTRDVLMAQDYLSQWLEQQCEWSDDRSDWKTPVEYLFASYRNFMEGLEEPKMSKHEFGVAMGKLGYTSDGARIDGKVRKCYPGIRLRP